MTPDCKNETPGCNLWTVVGTLFQGLLGSEWVFISGLKKFEKHC